MHTKKFNKIDTNKRSVPDKYSSKLTNTPKNKNIKNIIIFYLIIS